jgi:hypothetical protein
VNAVLSTHCVASRHIVHAPQILRVSFSSPWLSALNGLISLSWLLVRPKPIMTVNGYCNPSLRIYWSQHPLERRHVLFLPMIKQSVPLWNAGKWIATSLNHQSKWNMLYSGVLIAHNLIRERKKENRLYIIAELGHLALLELLISWHNIESMERGKMDSYITKPSK